MFPLQAPCFLINVWSMCLILCCKPLKAGRHGGQFLQTLWSDPLSPWHALSTCWQEESDRQARRTPFKTPVRIQARLPSRVTMVSVFNSNVYVHGWHCSRVKMCMPLITYRLINYISSFHVVVPWKPGHLKGYGQVSIHAAFCSDWKPWSVAASRPWPRRWR